MKKVSLTTAIATLLLASNAYATNGMNMEGYGPVSTAMGGTAQAYNNGLGGMMNNPATMGWDCAKDCAKLSVGLGVLQPTVKAKNIDMSMMGGPTAGSSSSDGTQYWMPGFGYAQKRGNLVLGVGVLAQGGMGTEYAGNTNLGVMLGVNGKPALSEVSVGRVIFPIAYKVNQNFQIGASVDFVWAGMDVRMDPMGSGGSTSRGGLPIEAANSDPYSGQMKGTGWGGKLGFVYRINPKLDIGASYHTKTNISDLSGSATIAGTRTKLKVIDFQWPETFGVGVAYRPHNDWLLAFDVKRIMWSNTMKTVVMNSPVFAGMGMPGGNLVLTQNWDDQTVYMLGVSYNVNKHLTLRAGINHADNPVPTSTINPLFPATVERHYTLGIGYKFNDHHSVDASAVIAPEVSVKGSDPATNAWLTSTHSQLNFQFLYTYHF